MQIKKIISIRKIGKIKTLDLEVDHKDHNFYAEGLVTSNSHSVSYAFLAAYCVYFKWNYPREFYLAWLKMSKNEPKPHEEIAKIYSELESFGIELLSPDLAKSKMDFTIEGDGIRFGLSSIKGVSEKSLDALREFRDQQDKTLGKFEIFHAAKACGLNIGILSALIQAGAISSFSSNRAHSALEAQVFNVLTDRIKKYVLLLVHEYDDDLFKFLKGVVESERKMDNGKTPILKKAQFDNIRAKCEAYIEIFKLNSKNAGIANWYFENQLLGYSYSRSLFDTLKREMPNIMPFEDFNNAEDRDKLNFCGIVRGVKVSKSKKGDNMMKLEIQDRHLVSCIFFGEKFDKWKDENTDAAGKTRLPKENDLVVVSGSKSSDVIFLNFLKVLEERAYFKLADLK